MSSNTYDFIPADRVEVFPLSQVGAKDESGFYTASGTPLKSVGISGVAGSELDVIEQPAEGTETRHRWLKNGDTWSLAEGTDAFSVSQGQVNTPMSPTMWKESRSFTDDEGNSKNENNVSTNHHLNSFLLKLVIFFLSFMCILKCESKADEVSHMNDKIVCKVYEYIEVNHQGFKVGRSCVQIYIDDILLGGLPVIGNVLHITIKQNKLSIYSRHESVEINMSDKSCKGSIRGEFKLQDDYFGIVKESPGFIRILREYHILPNTGK